MEFSYELFLLPVVASLIGYSTNWIAIRMLFRPLEEKRIFGFRVPFTPGLIPKRRNEIAKNIGQAVGTHLLTPEAIETRLQKPAVRDELEKTLSDWLVGFLEKDRGTVMEAVPEEARSELEAGFAELQEKVQNWLADITTGKEMEEFLRELVGSGVDLLSSKEIGEIVDQTSYEEIAIKLEDVATELTEREEVETLLEEFWVEKLRDMGEKGGSLEEYLGKELEGLLIRQVEANVPFLLRRGAELLDRPRLRTRLKEVVVDFLDERIEEGFDEDSVWDQVKRGFLETVVMPQERLKREVSEVIDEGIPKLMELMEQEEFRKEAAASGVKTLKRFLRKDVSELIPAEEGKEKAAGILTDVSLALLRSKKVRSFFSQGLVKVLKSSEGKRLDELVDLDQEEEKEAIVRSVSGYLVETIGSEDVQEELARVVSRQLEELKDRRLGKLSNWVDPERVTPFTGPIVDELLGVVSRQGPSLLGTIDVEEVVKQEVNNFPIDRVERLVLDVTGDQFRAITWFGALIGFLVGILQILILTLGGP